MLSVERSSQPTGSGRWRRAVSRPVLRPRERTDVIAIGALALLVGVGLANLDGYGARSLAEHQLLTVIAGAAVFLIARRARAAILYRLGWVSYLLSVLLLAVVAVAGSSDYGARRWLDVGTFTVQPSELAKIGLLLVLAQILGSDRGWPARLGLALLAAAIPIGLVVLEPDLSTATVLSAVTAVMLIFGRIPLRVLAAIAGVVALAAPFAAQLLHPYQLERLHAFLAGSRAADGPGWTILQAHIALAWGGLTGSSGGHLDALLSQYLPARETDLAFAGLIEQWGVAAGAVAVLAAVVLVWRLALAGRRTRTRPAALAAAGIGALVGIEVSVSVAANLGLLPTAGVPFPLLSYGGTAAAVHIAAVGLVLGLRAEAESHTLWIAPRWRRSPPRLLRTGTVAVSIGLVAMVAFVWNLQQTHGPGLRTAGLTQMKRCVPVPAPRGVISDRHGTPLAITPVQQQVWAVPALLDRHDEQRLAELTARPIGTLRRELSAPSDGPFRKVATLPTAASARLNAAHLPGVRLMPDPGRSYPYGALLGPILGWSGVATPPDMARSPTLRLGEIVGRAGIEQTYDPYLRGVDGSLCVYVDPGGRPVAMAPGREPVSGAPLRLTIDLGLQQRLSTALAASLHTGADLGAAVVLDPRNGQVLAMASEPGYDNNAYGPPVDDAALTRLAGRPGNPMLEHATQVAAPPGSTFKLAVASAAMVHQVLPPDEVVPTGESWTLAGHTFHNWMPLPPQDLAQAIAWSNDVYFYKLAWALGADAIVDTARQLGVGGPTGIDLPGEASGYLGTPSTVSQIGATWYPGSTVLLGIGQGYLTTTPLQDALWTSGVATGAMVQPHLGLAFGSTTGGAYTALSWPAPRPLPFAGRLGPVRAGMRAAVTGGTASALAALPAEVGAKTGTAEDSTAPAGATDSWLSAVAPLQAPAVAVTAFVHGGAGHGLATGPVQVALAYFLAHEQAILATAPAR